MFPSYVKLFHFWEHSESDKGKLTEASKACAEICILISDDLLDLYLNFSNSRRFNDINLNLFHTLKVTYSDLIANF